MKIINIKTCIIFSWIFLLIISGCEKIITDYGFDAAFSGTVVDQSGGVVYGDITSNGFRVRVQGESESTPMDIRVNGDGTYQNTKLFPQASKVWIEGPVTMVGDTLRYDFSTNKIVEHDIVVIPFITLETPAVVGTPAATSITFSYEIVPASGITINSREIYVSTSAYPNTTRGNGVGWHTRKATMATDTGEVTVTGLTTGTKYYIRAGARASVSAVYNFSDQIIVTTP